MARRPRIDKSRYTEVTTGKFAPVTPKMRDTGYTKLRHGIFDHTKAGKMTRHEFDVFLTLLRWINYHTGVTTTSAASIAANWGEWDSVADKEDESEDTKTKRKRRTIQNCLLQLRKKGYINYRPGDGKRGCYPVLIDKFEPTDGALLGWSLDLAGTGDDLDNPMYKYVSPTPFVDAYGEKYEAQHMGSCAEDVRLTVQSVCAATYGQCAVDCRLNCTVHVRLKDVLKMYEDIHQESKEPEERVRVQQESKPRSPADGQEKKADDFSDFKDIREWDEDKFNIPAERLKNCIIYQLDYSKDLWYRQTGISLASMDKENFVKKLDRETPPGWTPESHGKPKPKPKVFEPSKYPAMDAI